MLFLLGLNVSSEKLGPGPLDELGQYSASFRRTNNPTRKAP